MFDCPMSSPQMTMILGFPVSCAFAGDGATGGAAAGAGGGVRFFCCCAMPGVIAPKNKAMTSKPNKCVFDPTNFLLEPRCRRHATGRK